MLVRVRAGRVGVMSELMFPLLLCGETVLGMDLCLCPLGGMEGEEGGGEK